jgi:transcriptional regulator with PAS, ATPase and Fis domain
VVAATNENFEKAIQSGKFREDLFYRLNQVPIAMPPLRERGQDVVLLFKKFAADFSEKYRVPMLQLTPESELILTQYPWPGNIRQLKNITEQMSLLEEDRWVHPETLSAYLPTANFGNKGLIKPSHQNQDFSEREILYKVLFDMRNDLTDLKKLVLGIIQNGVNIGENPENAAIYQRIFSPEANSSVYTEISDNPVITVSPVSYNTPMIVNNPIHHEVIEETLSLSDTEKEMIRKALQKHKNRRRNAAKELGISERTLYRKIKEYDLGK